MIHFPAMTKTAFLAILALQICLDRRGFSPNAMDGQTGTKTRAALAEIGSYFGGRRHSAVICAEKKVDNWIAEHAAIEAADGAYPVEDTLRKLERALESTRA